MPTFEIVRSNEKSKLEQIYAHTFGQLKFLCDKMNSIQSSIKQNNCFEPSSYNASTLPKIVRIRRNIQIVQASYPEDFQESIENEVSRYISSNININVILSNPKNAVLIKDFISNMYEIHNYYVHNIFSVSETNAPYFLLVIKINNMISGMIWVHLSDGSSAYEDKDEEEYLRLFGHLIPSIKSNYATMIGITSTVSYFLAKLVNMNSPLPRITEYLIPEVIRLVKSFNLEKLYVSPLKNIKDILIKYYGFVSTPVRKDIVHLTGWGTWPWHWKEMEDIDFSSKYVNPFMDAGDILVLDLTRF